MFTPSGAYPANGGVGNGDVVKDRFEDLQDHFNVTGIENDELVDNRNFFAVSFSYTGNIAVEANRFWWRNTTGFEVVLHSVAISCRDDVANTDWANIAIQSDQDASSPPTYDMIAAGVVGGGAAASRAQLGQPGLGGVILGAGPTNDVPIELTGGSLQNTTVGDGKSVRVGVSAVNGGAMTELWVTLMFTTPHTSV